MKQWIIQIGAALAASIVFNFFGAVYYLLAQTWGLLPTLLSSFIVFALIILWFIRKDL